MNFLSRAAFLFVFTAFFLNLMPVAAHAYDEENRTANRTVLGRIVYPGWLFTKPEHYEFLPLTSNHDPLNDHPAAWQGQDWDVSKWNKRWTPDIAIQKFFQARIFNDQYMEGSVPVVEVGPTFYKISNLDQRRTLKLLTDTAGVFKNGFNAVELVDWSTKDVVGTYTPKGLFLN